MLSNLRTDESGEVSSKHKSILRGDNRNYSFANQLLNSDLDDRKKKKTQLSKIY